MRYRLGAILLLILLNVQFIHLGFIMDKISSANAYDINWELNDEEEKIKKLEIEKLETKKIQNINSINKVALVS